MLSKVLDGLHAGPANVSLKELGLSTPLGKLQKTNGIFLTNDAAIVYQSPSGLFERKIRLKDL